MKILVIAWLGFLGISSCSSKSSLSGTSKSPTIKKINDDDPSSSCADYFPDEKDRAKFTKCREAQSETTPERCLQSLKNQLPQTFTDAEGKALCRSSAPPFSRAPQDSPTPQAQTQEEPGRKPAPRPAPKDPSSPSTRSTPQTQTQDEEPPNPAPLTPEQICSGYFPLTDTTKTRGCRSALVNNSRDDCMTEALALYDTPITSDIIQRIRQLCKTSNLTRVTCTSILRSSGKYTRSLNRKCERAVKIDYSRKQWDAPHRQYIELAANDSKLISHDRCRAALTGDALERIRLKPPDGANHSVLYDEDSTADITLGCYIKNTYPDTHKNSFLLALALVILGDKNKTQNIFITKEIDTCYTPTLLKISYPPPPRKIILSERRFLLIKRLKSYAILTHATTVIAPSISTAFIENLFRMA